ncbi:MAG: 4Fe-4S dicluster domain-containing protein [Deltaproteobacteria bacterium]|nr:4Fe-4S dicluster domain-containing protein [Deltaproteobacteria bacterium]
MREVVVISGKGGTGKTSLTAAFAHLAENKVVCDLDVDAPDLHLLLNPTVTRAEEFISGHEAVIDPEKCTGCGICASMCRYDAIDAVDGVYRVDPLRCEGCKVCVAFCPVEAIDFPARHCGQWYMSETRFGPMVHAQLFPGQENSGLLVSRLKKEARAFAEAKGLDLILCDGAPGIGCPVIASLSQTDLAVVVTEPTPSGVHDLERVASLCGHFRTKVAVVVNKYDLNPDQTHRIEALCREKGYTLAALLPHDTIVTEAMVRRLAVTELENTDFGRLTREAWATITALLNA